MKNHHDDNIFTSEPSIVLWSNMQLFFSIFSFTFATFALSYFKYDVIKFFEDKTLYKLWWFNLFAETKISQKKTG